MTTNLGKTSGVMLVRDPNGNVKFDDWDNIHEDFHHMLSEEDWKYIESNRNKEK